MTLIAQSRMTKRGWSNFKAYRVRAAHIVDASNQTRGLCGAPVRTLVRPKGANNALCDWCQKARRRLRAYARRA